MAEKKLFPGVTEKDLLKLGAEKLKQQEQMKAMREAEEKFAVEEEDKKTKQAAYKKYTSKSARMTAADRIRYFCKVNAVSAASLFLLGNASWVLTQASPYTDSNGHGFVSNSWYKPYKAAIHDAYIPTDKYYGYGWEDEDGFVNEKPGFAPSAAWGINVFLSLTVLLCSIVGAKRLNDEQDTVDMMLDLEEFGKQYKLDAKQVKRLVDKYKKIIEHMSADKRVYFDMLMAGEMPIKDQETLQAMAVSVMTGHLQSHPEDLKMVLETFEERSIPEQIKNMVKQTER
jgi:hypothetical protein